MNEKDHFVNDNCLQALAIQIETLQTSHLIISVSPVTSK